MLVSDGVSSVVSDDEVVDLARDAADPKQAADRILAFAEEMGSEDNATAIVVPLAGWGKIQGPDKTKDLREYRQRQAGQFCLIYYTIDRLILSQLDLKGNVECDHSPLELRHITIGPSYTCWKVIPGLQINLL